MADKINNDPIPVNLPEGMEDGLAEFAEKARSWNAWEMRLWLERACQNSGGMCVGGSIGLGDADIDVLYNGVTYNIRIKPYPTTPRKDGEDLV